MTRPIVFIVPALDNVEAHWTQINAWAATQITTTEMVMPDGLTLAQLIALDADFDAKRGVVGAKRQLWANKGAAVTAQKVKLRNKIRQFRNAVSDIAPGSQYEKDLPRVPQLDQSRMVFDALAQKVEDIWAPLNTDNTLPDWNGALLLQNSYSLAEFQLDRTQLNVRHNDMALARAAFNTAREARDGVRAVLDAFLDRYPRRVKAFLPEGHPELATIPRTTPRSGVVIPQLKGSAVWDAAAGHAVVTLQGTVHPDCNRIELQLSLPNAPWDAESAETVVTISGDAVFTTHSVILPADAIAPGDFVYAKLVVILNSGNERASKAFKIVVPEGD